MESDNMVEDGFHSVTIHRRHRDAVETILEYVLSWFRSKYYSNIPSLSDTVGVGLHGEGRLPVPQGDADVPPLGVGREALRAHVPDGGRRARLRQGRAHCRQRSVP